MTRLTASQEIIKNAISIIDRTDIDRVKDDLKILNRALKQLAIEKVLLEDDEEPEELRVVWPKVKQLKATGDWSFSPMVCYSTGEAVEPYMADPYLHCHEQEESFLEAYGKNRVMKVVLLDSILMLFLVADSYEDLIIND